MRFHNEREIKNETFIVDNNKNKYKNCVKTTKDRKYKKKY